VAPYPTEESICETEFKISEQKGASWGPQCSEVGPDGVKTDLFKYGQFMHHSKGNLMLINIYIRNMVWKTTVQKILGPNKGHVIRQKGYLFK
jgi:hypothetical protein